MSKIFKILFLTFCAITIYCYGYDDNLGNFLLGEASLSNSTYSLTDMAGGSILGQAQKNTFEMDTFSENGTLEDADVRMIARNIEITYQETLENTPTDNSVVYPGTQLTFHLLLVNFKNVWADNYNIRDIIPANTHLYYSGKPPTLNGAVYNIEYLGVTSNAGPGNIVEFLFDLAPSGSATFSYTVTVD